MIGNLKLESFNRRFPICQDLTLDKKKLPTRTHLPKRHRRLEKLHYRIPPGWKLPASFCCEWMLWAHNRSKYFQVSSQCPSPPSPGLPGFWQAHKDFWPPWTLTMAHKYFHAGPVLATILSHLSAFPTCTAFTITEDAFPPVLWAWKFPRMTTPPTNRLL